MEKGQQLKLYQKENKKCVEILRTGMFLNGQASSQLKLVFWKFRWTVLSTLVPYLLYGERQHQQKMY